MLMGSIFYGAGHLSCSSFVAPGPLLANGTCNLRLIYLFFGIILLIFGSVKIKLTVNYISDNEKNKQLKMWKIFLSDQ